VIGDALHDVAQIELRIKSVELGRPKQRIDGSGTLLEGIDWRQPQRTWEPQSAG
jgi:hypothetical protein